MTDVTPAVPAIPAAAVAYLKANPGLAAKFDEKYGAGLAANYLRPVATPAAPAIPEKDIAYLKANPGIATRFDEKYGAGASTKVLPQESNAESIGRGIVRGIGGAISETIDTAADAVNYTITDPLLALAGKGPTPRADLSAVAPDEVKVDAPERLSGQLTEGFTQFVTGLVGLGKFSALSKIPDAVTSVGKVAQAGTRSAVVAATAFDPYDGNVANFVEQYPSLRNPVSDFFAVDDADTAVEARLKNALADLVVGVPIDGILTGLKALRAKARGDQPTAEDHLERLAANERAPDPALDPLVNDVMGAPARSASAADAAAAKEAAKPAGSIANPPVRIGEDLGKEMVERIRASNDDVDLALNVNRTAPTVEVWDRFFSGKEDFNFRKIIETNAGKEPYAALAVLDELGTAFRTEIDEARGGAVETLQQTKVQADEFARKAGQKPDEFFSMLAGDAKSAQKVAGRLKAYKDVTLTLADSVQSLARRYEEGRPPNGMSMDELGAELLRRNEFLANILALTKTVQTGTARAVSAGRLGARVNPRLLKAIEEGNVAGQLAPDKKSIELFARTLSAAGSPTDVLKLSKLGRAGYAGDAISRFWINSILSGPATHLVNAVSNGLKAVVMPAERFLAGAYGGNKAEMQAALRTYFETYRSLGEAWKVTRVALNRGENILDAKGTVQDQGYHQKSAADLSQAFASGNYAQASLIATDILFNLPTRVLASSDEFFKQISYRSHVSSTAWAEGHARGLKGAELENHIETKLADAFDETGAGTDQTAIANARDATFTTDLKPGFASWLQIGKQMNPWMNMVLPFVKTPANVLADWAYRSGLHADVYRDISAGGQRRNEALAKLTVGATFYSMATLAVQSGNLTGMGPQNAETKKLWKAAGNQPYSVKVGDAWYSYNRFDPFGMFFGIAADMAEVAAHKDDRDGQKLAEMALISFSRNLSNKTYFRGVADVVDALFERGPQVDEKIKRVLNGYAGGFVPMSGYVNSLKDDPYMREARTMLDAIANRTPGWSAELDPQRNVLGEPVLSSELGGLSPVAKTTDKPDVLAEELFRIFESSGEQVEKPPRITGGIDWTTYKSESGQSAYDRYLELHVGMGFREKMTEVMQQGGYKKLSASGRAEVFRSVQGAVRRGAKGRLFKEFPELSEAVRKQERAERLGLLDRAAK